MFIHLLWFSMQVFVATFAITAYASSYNRAGSKPFNPVLGETYECDRPDKGFRFIAEQVRVMMTWMSWERLSEEQRPLPHKTLTHYRSLPVIIVFAVFDPPVANNSSFFCVIQVSHHPPVSACHADSRNFTFWQGEQEGACWGYASSCSFVCGLSEDRPTVARKNLRWNHICVNNLMWPW